MKSGRFVLPVVLLFSTVAFAQSDVQKSARIPAPSEAQKSFDAMKTFAGEWDGPVTVPEAPDMSGGKLHLSLRVTSRETRSFTNFRKPTRHWTRPSTTIPLPCFTWKAISST
jgi:hypothetical protein